MPDEIDVRAEGDLRIITLNRPDDLNSVNHVLHEGLSKLWGRLNEDQDVRAAVITGAGRAFSAGGDFRYLEELSKDADLRAVSIQHGREIVLGMCRLRVPLVAAVNGPAVGLGCSLLALSDMVFMHPDAILSDPHVLVGLVAADGGPLTWPLHTSMLLAKEYALTGARIKAPKAVEMGLANHIAEDPLASAVEAAQKISRLPRMAVESTKRLLNLQLERNVLATLDYATSMEERTMGTEDFRTILAGLTAKSS